MKKSTERKMNVIAMAILGFNVAGVISIFIIRSVLYPGDLLANGSLLLESIPAPGTSLSDVKTCAHPNELVVTGHIRRENDAQLQGRGEVTITLLSPTGEVLDSRGAWYSLPPDDEHRLAHFEEHFDAVPPKGSVLRIEWTAPSREKVRGARSGPNSAALHLACFHSSQAARSCRAKSPANSVISRARSLLPSEVHPPDRQHNPATMMPNRNLVLIRSNCMACPFEAERPAG